MDIINILQFCYRFENKQKNSQMIIQYFYIEKISVEWEQSQNLILVAVRFHQAETL